MSRAREFADLAGSADAGGLTGRNMIINGAFQVWQRATSNASVTSNSYPAADRWKFWANGSTMGTTRTAFTVGQTDVPNIKYYNSIAIASNSGTGHYHTINHHVEDITRFDNVKVTLSFYAKASVAWTVGIEPIQNFGSGGSPSSRVLGTTQTVSVGTSWAKHEVTISLASISGKTLGTTANTSNFEIAMWLSGGSDFNARTGSIGNQSGTIDIAAVQLEVGEQATPFEHRSYQDEYLRSTRYFYQWKSNSGYHKVGFGRAWSTSNCVAGVFRTPVPMRALPTLTNSGLGDFAVAGVGGTPTAMGIAESSTDFRTFALSVDQTSAFTAGALYQTETDNVTGAYLRFDSEL